MKKLTAMLLAGMMCISLAACGGTKEEAADTTAAETTETAEEADTTVADTDADTTATDGTVTTVTEGVLTMGTNAAFPPYEYKEGDKIVGIDAEIAQALADKLGLELEIQDMDFSSLITAVQSGKIDISLAGMTVNEERKKNVDFTDSYAKGVQVIIVKEDSDITSGDDLANDKLIGVQQGTTGHNYCESDFGEEHVLPFDNGAMAIQALLQDKVDCVVIDQQPAKEFVAANEGLKILDSTYADEDYAAAVSKDNPALTAALNKALQELKDDGTIQSILDKYIKAE